MEAALQLNGGSPQKVHSAKLIELPNPENQENVSWVPGKTSPSILLQTIKRSILLWFPTHSCSILP